jgi:hypothetical protein
MADVGDDEVLLEPRRAARVTVASKNVLAVKTARPPADQAVATTDALSLPVESICSAKSPFRRRG